MLKKNKKINDTDITVKFSKMFLPAKECIKILKHIDKMGYNAYTLFPWYYGVTKSINEEDIIKKCEEIIESSNQRNQVKKNADNYRDIQCSNYKVSAGTGYNLENEDSWYNIKIENTNEARRANFALEISGDSMLPRFENGDIVLVRSDGEANIGDVGVFEVNGEGYIKKRGEDRLISINEEYEDIYVTENDNFKCFGKVIGKAVLVETSNQR